MAKRKPKLGRPKEKKKPKPIGRPPKFNEAMGTKIIELVSQGVPNEEIADLIGVHRNTLFMWTQNNIDLKVALKQAAQFADELVEASLFRRACGYSHPAEKHFLDKQLVTDEETGQKYLRSNVITHEYTEHYPPSEQAAMFWLRNRQPERWKEKPEAPPPDPNTSNVVIYETEWGTAGEPSGGADT